MIKVLLVDDSALVRKLFAHALADQRDMQWQFARDGAEALQMLQTFQPDVITLDINMPGMDGLECLDRIMVLRPTPVLMVSSLTREGADQTLEALRLGAVDFVPKPGGAVSMRMAQFGPTLIERIRTAATTRVRRSHRLLERLQQRSRTPLVRHGGRAQAMRSRGPAAVSAPGAIGGLVVVGTSTGGPPALEALLTALPADFAWPIVIAQHMPASFTGPLAARLDSLSQISVVEVAEPMPLSAGHAYIGRGDADVVITRRSSTLMVDSVQAQADYLWHPSADRLVRSAMTHWPAARTIGVLLTGMGNDGAAAMSLLRQQGGQTIAESDRTAVVWGMPGALVSADGASFIEPLPAIADRLLQRVSVDAADP